jgi:hypothetical protein
MWNPLPVIRFAPPAITPYYKISGILAVWPGYDKENIKNRVRGSWSCMRKDVIVMGELP